ncbi:(2Fe-2S)-binding protein [Paenibacillus athensensis]|uniref:Ferric siderophore reductase C-terminal domain-containing protein n=1 Tax=Paenibacillus athensensis TaxID=1967502 RepID=A0A4Y8QA80_9BACL|nr:(2Fe-2S)-binding protein [Paenibacillus athensensis]MCD1257684.1 (2Fe-2S)-binding protein [Paenibacillus athensensis]
MNQEGISSQILKHYHLVDKGREDASLSIQLSRLKSKTTLQDFLHKLMPFIHTNNPVVAATHFMSWFGSVCAAFQAGISLTDAALDVRLANLSFQLYFEGNQRKTSFVLHVQDPFSTLKSDENRSAWRTSILNEFYSQEVKPLILSLVTVSGATANQLWAQFTTRLHNEKDILLEQNSAARKDTILADFDALLNELDLESLGLVRNPFNVSFRFIPHLTEEEQQIRQRATCCLAYETDTGKGFCYSCPKMSEQEREARREAVRAG